MASRYRLSTAPQDTVGRLEIRGLSRGSASDRRLQFGTTSSLELYHREFKTTPDPESEDDSTVKGGSSDGDDFFPSKVPGQDTMTESESSHYWSGANSTTTGNTTERSSLYSWGDDVLDHKTSRNVQEMFRAIERMLFESVLSGSSLLQQECREWMHAFPHLRIRGKQVAPIRDEGVQSHPPSQATSGVATPVSEIQGAEDDTSVLSLTGSSVTPIPTPQKLFTHTSDNSNSGQTTELSYLHEEIFEQDGEVEEYLAYDIREMDEEDTAKRYHVPRRRRLGYPPITPNACVRDAVISQLFDSTWVKLISNLNKVKIENDGLKKTTKSFWKVLFDSYSSMIQNFDVTRLAENNTYFYRPAGKGAFDDEGLDFNFMEERNPAILISHSEQFGSHLPPSSWEFVDHGLRGGRLSGRYPNTNRDFTSLNSVMMIKRKELINRTDKSNGALTQDPSIDMCTPSIERSEMYPRLTGSKLQLPGSSSPLVYSQFFPHSTHRQPSAKLRSRGARSGAPFRLQPLDRPKTPTTRFDWTVKAKKIPISSLGLTNLDEHSGVGIRVTSPRDPPPTAPAISGGSLYSRNLPPLQSLNENTSVDFPKKTRGRVGRISSAIAEDRNKHAFRGLEGASRPSTTHAFRNDGLYKPRALSITPSNFSSRALGGRGFQPIKSSSPTGLGPGGSLFYAHNFSHSPDNHAPGLAGIHGISMLVQGASHSPHEHDDEDRPAVWGNAVRRRQPLIGN